MNTKRSLRFMVFFVSLFLLGAPSVFSLNFHSFRPSDTTTGIDPLFDDFHEVYHNPDVKQRNKLMVFLPGTSVSPNVYKFFPETAAQHGFHVINLMYVNSFVFIAMAITVDCDECYTGSRMEILTGEDLSIYEIVNRNNSIEHRLIKAIEYLQTNYPSENWSQYLQGTNILWKSVVIAGHSQGGGEAGFIAKQYSVDRAIMFNSGDWYDGDDRPATWIATPGATQSRRFFGAAHVSDPLFPEPHQLPVWTTFGLTNFGASIFVEDTTDPQFNGSRMLRTDVEPRDNTGDLAYHGAMVRDEHVPLNTLGVPIFRTLWEYLLFGRLTSSATFDSDSSYDLASFYPPSGTWSLLQSIGSYEEIQFGARGMIPLEADFDGDGELDICVFEKKSGTWFISESNGGFRPEQLGSASTIPVPADYDGDLKSDLAVYEPSNGAWFIQLSAGGNRSVQLGNRRMYPVPADYDGDGKADIAVYDPISSTWYLSKSTEGTATVAFGQRGNWPAQGDYDGDGKTDIGVYDPRNSMWNIMRTFEGPLVTQFGFRGVVPVNRDYDGDGRDDIGVYDPVNATWYLMQSQAGFRQESFGRRNSIPLGTPIHGRIPVRGLRKY